MWDFDPPPQVQISVCVYVVLLPYVDDIVVLFMGSYVLGKILRGGVNQYLGHTQNFLLFLTSKTHTQLS